MNDYEHRCFWDQKGTVLTADDITKCIKEVYDNAPAEFVTTPYKWEYYKRMEELQRKKRFE